MRFCLRDAGGTGLLSRLRRGPRCGLLEEPSAPVGMPRLRTADLADRRHGDASIEIAADDVVLGGASNGDAFQRHVGATIGGPTRRHLQDGLAAGAEASALDGRSRPRSSRRRRRGGSDGDSLPRRRRVLRARLRRQNPGRRRRRGDRPRRRQAEAEAQGRKVSRHPFGSVAPGRDRRQLGQIDRGVRARQREAWHDADHRRSVGWLRSTSVQHASRSGSPATHDRNQLRRGRGRRKAAFLEKPPRRPRDFSDAHGKIYLFFRMFAASAKLDQRMSDRTSVHVDDESRALRADGADKWRGRKIVFRPFDEVVRAARAL